MIKQCMTAKISLFDEFQTPYVYVCGDFDANTRCTSQFGDELSQLCFFSIQTTISLVY